MHAPEPDMRAITKSNQRAIAARTEAHRPHRTRIGPHPHLAIELAVAEGARLRCRARTGEDLPAAFHPQVIIKRGVAAPGTMLRQVIRHLLLGCDWNEW